MLIPQNFPCDAWIVTRALRLKKVHIVENLRHYAASRTGAGEFLMWSELHKTQAEAVVAAVEKLDAEEARVERAVKRLEQHKKNVNAMFLAAQEGGAA